MSMEGAPAATARSTALRAVPGAFPVGAVLGAAAVMGSAAVLLMSTHGLSLIVCYFKVFTGQPCLTCGGTRAAVRLLALDPAGALAMNPLVTVCAFLLGAWAVVDVVLLTRRRALQVTLGGSAARAVRILLPIAVIANWVYLIAVGR